MIMERKALSGVYLVFVPAILGSIVVIAFYGLNVLLQVLEFTLTVAFSEHYLAKCDADAICWLRRRCPPLPRLGCRSHRQQLISSKKSDPC